MALTTCFRSAPDARPGFLPATLIGAALLLVACGHRPVVTPPPPVERSGVLGLQGWSPFVLPGKRFTEYAVSTKDGRPSIRAQADRSASMWRQAVHRNPADLKHLHFSWWVEDTIADADLSDTQQEDAPARIVLAFDGDRSRLSQRNRMVFELAHSLTGEAPPYATLMYVWDQRAPVGQVIVSGRSDRIRKIVLESGPGHRRQWRDYRRDIAADFRLAFGEDPGPLIGVALMTDADNTQSRAEAWYGEIRID